MTLDNLQHCKLSKYPQEGEAKIYDFVSDNGYCFRNNAEPLKDEEGNIYFDHTTAFTLFAEEIDKLADYDCIEFEEGMVIH